MVVCDFNTLREQIISMFCELFLEYISLNVWIKACYEHLTFSTVTINSFLTNLFIYFYHMLQHFWGSLKQNFKFEWRTFHNIISLFFTRSNFFNCILCHIFYVFLQIVYYLCILHYLKPLVKRMYWCSFHYTKSFI